MSDGIKRRKKLKEKQGLGNIKEQQVHNDVRKLEILMYLLYKRSIYKLLCKKEIEEKCTSHMEELNMWKI